MPKNKREKAAHGFRVYNLIMSNVWRFLTTLLVGVLAGYLVSRNGPDGNNYWLFMILVFLVIGILNFFLGIYKDHKKLVAREEAKKKLMQEEENKNEENRILTEDKERNN